VKRLSKTIKEWDTDKLLDGIEEYHCFSNKLSVDDLDFLMRDKKETEEKQVAFLTLLVRELRNKLGEGLSKQ